MKVDCGSFLEWSVKVEARTFLLQVQRFGNGLFVSVSEGDAARIGSLAVSLVSQAGALPVTTTIIPPRDPTLAFFMRMVSEQTSSRLGGIAIVSVHTKGNLDTQASKILLGAIVDTVNNNDNNRERKP